MIASAYIKDGNIHFYNEKDSFSNIGGLAYELGKPLLNFLCYEQERFDEAISAIVSAFEMPGADIGMHSSEFKSAIKEHMTEVQKNEPYIFFFLQSLLESVYLGESPNLTAQQLSRDFQSKRNFMISQVQLLINFREVVKTEKDELSTAQLLYLLDEFNKHQIGEYVYLEKPRYSFYGVIKPPEVVELSEIHSIDDLCRFEFVKMIEHSIFIKKCKNCEQFFIPNRRQDVEYCDRVFADTNRKCSEIGAMLRYEKKVAENPVWDVYKKAYRRINSRTRNKKMTQLEFLQWSEEAAKNRDKCLAGEISFEEYVAWLEQGRIRKPRNAKAQSDLTNDN